MFTFIIYLFRMHKIDILAEVSKSVILRMTLSKSYLPPRYYLCVLFASSELLWALVVYSSCGMEENAVKEPPLLQNSSRDQSQTICLLVNLGRACKSALHLAQTEGTGV